MDTLENGYTITETFSNASGDGRMYPDTFKVVEVDNGFEVWDFTGWTGFEVCDPFMVAHFDTTGHNYPALAHKMARDCAWSLASFSDIQRVFEAAVELVNKRPGSFSALKAAVDWRDK